MKKTYLIKDLKESKDLFNQFRMELPSSWLKYGSCTDVNSFLEEFERRDTSCDTYVYNWLDYAKDGSVYANDELIHNKFGDSAEIEEFACVEIGSNSFIYLYGYVNYYDWSDVEQRYLTSCFGNFYKVIID